MFYQNGSSVSSSKLPSQISYSNRRSQARQFRSIYTSINQTDFSKARKVYNMEDPSQQRIKRSKHFLYESSNKQAPLFEKGVKRINLKNNAKQQQKSISLSESRGITRRYNNKSTIQLNGSPKFNESSVFRLQQGGKKKVDGKVYQQRAGKAYMANSGKIFNVFDNSKIESEQSSICQNRKKIFLNKHKKQQNDKQNYIITAIPKKQVQGQTVIKKQIHLNFTKKTNRLNERNFQQTDRIVQNSKKHFIEIMQKQNLVHDQFGIGTGRKQEKKAIDFDKDYYNSKRNERIPKSNSSMKMYLKKSTIY